MEHTDSNKWYGTTVLCVRKGKDVVMGADGQVSIGATVVKSTAKKTRLLAGGSILASANDAGWDRRQFSQTVERFAKEHQLLVEPGRVASGFGTSHPLKSVWLSSIA